MRMFAGAQLVCAPRTAARAAQCLHFLLQLLLVVPVQLTVGVVSERHATSIHIELITSFTYYIVSLHEHVANALLCECKATVIEINGQPEDLDIVKRILHLNRSKLVDSTSVAGSKWLSAGERVVKVVLMEIRGLTSPLARCVQLGDLATIAIAAAAVAPPNVAGSVISSRTLCRGVTTRNGQEGNIEYGWLLHVQVLTTTSYLLPAGACRPRFSDSGCVRGSPARSRCCGSRGSWSRPSPTRSSSRTRTR